MIDIGAGISIVSVTSEVIRSQGIDRNNDEIKPILNEGKSDETDDDQKSGYQ